MPKAPKAKVGQDKKPIHPNSRKAQQLSRKIARDQRVSTSKAATSVKAEVLGERCLWIKDNIDPEKKTLTKAELAVLVKEYLNRFQDELDQISIVRGIGNRQGQQFVSRETAIRMTMEKEKSEFDNAGLEIPDLINGKNLNYFRLWNGEIKYLQNMKFRRISSKDLLNEPELEEDKERTADNSDMN